MEEVDSGHGSPPNGFSTALGHWGHNKECSGVNAPLGTMWWRFFHILLVETMVTVPF